MHFQRITTLTLDVRYGSNDIFNQDLKLRLPTAVQNRSEMFSNNIELKGRTFQFHHKPLNPTPGSIDWPDTKTVDFKGCGKVDNLINIRKMPNHLDLDDQDVIPGPNNESILVWLTEVYTTSCGFEMRMFNPLLLAIIMKKQSIN